MKKEEKGCQSIGLVSRFGTPTPMVYVLHILHLLPFAFEISMFDHFRVPQISRSPHSNHSNLHPRGRRRGLRRIPPNSTCSRFANTRPSPYSDMYTHICNICTYIYIYIYTIYLYIYIYTHIYIYIRYLYIYIYTYIHDIHIYIYTHLFMYYAYRILHG